MRYLERQMRLVSSGEVRVSLLPVQKILNLFRTWNGFHRTKGSASSTVEKCEFLAAHVLYLTSLTTLTLTSVGPESKRATTSGILHQRCVNIHLSQFSHSWKICYKRYPALCDWGITKHTLDIKNSVKVYPIISVLTQIIIQKDCHAQTNNTKY